MSPRENLAAPGPQGREGTPVVALASDAADVHLHVKAALEPHGITVKPITVPEVMSGTPRIDADLLILDLEPDDAPDLVHLAATLPTIVLFAAAESDRGAALLETGIADVVTKPCHGAVLAQRVLRCLDKRAPSDDAPSVLDPLTGVWTLAAFRHDLRRAVARARRAEHVVAVVILDLDRFARVNAEFGHDAGDQVLRETARRLTAALRETDVVARTASSNGREACAVSRVGGDRFAVMLEGLESGPAAAGVMQRVLDAFEEPFAIAEQAIHLTARVGVSLHPEDGLDASALLRNAETAANDAQRTDEAAATASTRIRFFSREVGRIQDRELELERSLRAAIASDSVNLFYQPKISLRDETVIGFEALLRHQHDGKLADAQKTIALAERRGLIRDLGMAIFRRVCRDAILLRDQTGRPLRLFTNFSPIQLESPSWLADVQAALDETGVDPSLLGVEITETVLLEDQRVVCSDLEHLAERGLEISLDDFGTGYSSLSYLTRLPLHEIKIDRSFVAELPGTRPESLEIAGLMVILGRTLDLRVVAEGTETETQVNLLRGMGCNAAQGYCYARPRPLETFFEELRREAVTPAKRSP